MITKTITQAITKTKSGNSGRVYVPIEWVSKRVKIILLEK